MNALKFYHQFVLYKLEPSVKRPGKTDKLPLNPETFRVSDAHDPSIWGSYEKISAIKNLCGKDYGIGFVFTEKDPFFFLDIDNCLQPDNTWSPLATELLSVLSGAGVEISQSGKGLHVIGSYTRQIKHSCKNSQLNIELYTSGRFCALTDIATMGDAAMDCTNALQWVVDKYFPPAEEVIPVEWRNTPVPEWRGHESDIELIERAMRSSSAKSKFGVGASFADLWTANTAVLAQAYPPLNQVDPYDRSSADHALAHHLAFWTGKNHDRIYRLMWQSALVRDKWRSHLKYLGMTITRAVASQKDVYSMGASTSTQPVAVGGSYGDGMMTTGVQLMTPTQQLEYFRGCVYIRNIHRIFTPDGSMLRHEQFKAAYGGFTFSMDQTNEKTTKNAWECFTESQAIRFPQAHGTCFRPELPSGVIIDEESHKLVNIYVPIITKRTPADVTPFIEHVKKMLPNQEEQDIVLAYMAACVQHKGVKFQWCPLIQGTEGNGKTLLGNVLAYAIGNRYTHVPNASDLGGNGVRFNSWIVNKLLIIIEEIYTSDRREITEPLKVLITNSRIEIQGKGQDQYTGDCRANFMLFTNHKDAIYVTIDSRRYCILYCAQQNSSDLAKYGMSGDYFPKLYEWLKTGGGYEAVNEYLHTYPIPDHLNPAKLCQRAPVTGSMVEAIELSRGGVEAEIMEAVDEGRPGFVEPYVSSIAISKLLKQIGADRKIPPNKRKDVMGKLGYVLHPGLEKGRLHKNVAYEGGKPRLYVKRGHPDMMVRYPNVVWERYMTAQGFPLVDSPDDPE